MLEEASDSRSSLIFKESEPLALGKKQAREREGITIRFGIESALSASLLLSTESDAIDSDSRE